MVKQIVITNKYRDCSSHYEKLANGEVRCIDSELPFEIPNGWEWVRMNELGIYRKGPFGSSLTKAMFVPKSETSIKVYEQKNAIQKDYRLGEYYISQDKYKSMQSFNVQPNDIIVSCAGTIGETYLLPKEAPVGIINQALMRVCLYHLPLSDFWQIYFDYVLIKEAKMKGAGSAIKNIPPFEYLKAILVPLPPEAEQKRIVKCYSELLQKVEHFENLREAKELLNASIYAKLKKSILQEAIQGKLVEQCATDEPASKLLERIKEEKKQLIKAGKLKAKDIIDSVIIKGDDNKYYEQIDGKCVEISNEIPFDIPDNWTWSRLSLLIMLISGTSYDKNDVCKGGIRILRGGNIQESKLLILDNDVFLPNSYADANKQIKANDIIIVGSTGSKDVIGKPAFIKQDYPSTQIGAFLRIVRPYFDFYVPYLQIIFSSEYYRKHIRSKVKGTNINNIKAEHIEKLLVPVPPLNEIMRIIKRMEELYSKL